MKILPFGAFEYHFIRDQARHWATGNGHKSLMTRIKDLAGKSWDRVIFRECKKCHAFNLFDDGLHGDWHPKNLIWKQLVKNRFPQFDETKHIAYVTCDNCFKAEEDKKKDNGQALLRFLRWFNLRGRE